MQVKHSSESLIQVLAHLLMMLLKPKPEFKSLWSSARNFPAAQSSAQGDEACLAFMYNINSA